MFLEASLLKGKAGEVMYKYKGSNNICFASIKEAKKYPWISCIKITRDVTVDGRKIIPKGTVLEFNDRCPEGYIISPFYGVGPCIRIAKECGKEIQYA